MIFCILYTIPGVFTVHVMPGTLKPKGSHFALVWGSHPSATNKYLSSHMRTQVVTCICGHQDYLGSKVVVVTTMTSPGITYTVTNSGTMPTSVVIYTVTTPGNTSTVTTLGITCTMANTGISYTVTTPGIACTVTTPDITCTVPTYGITYTVTTSVTTCTVTTPVAERRVHITGITYTMTIAEITCTVMLLYTQRHSWYYILSHYPW